VSGRSLRTRSHFKTRTNVKSDAIENSLCRERNDLLFWDDAKDLARSLATRVKNLEDIAFKRKERCHIDNLVDLFRRHVLEPTISASKGKLPVEFVKDNHRYASFFSTLNLHVTLLDASKNPKDPFSISLVKNLVYTAPQKALLLKKVEAVDRILMPACNISVLDVATVACNRDLYPRALPLNPDEASYSDECGLFITECEMFPWSDSKKDICEKMTICVRQALEKAKIKRCGAIGLQRRNDSGGKNR